MSTRSAGISTSGRTKLWTSVGGGADVSAASVRCSWARFIWTSFALLIVRNSYANLSATRVRA